MTEKVLWRNEWLSAILKDGWYTFFRHRANGVSVLVIDEVAKKILVRVEHTPCHADGFKLTALTGSMEDFGLGEMANAENTAVMELREEAGIHAEILSLVFLGWVWPLKSSDYKQFLFALPWSVDAKRHEIVGDGSRGEEGADVKWVTYEEALMIEDPSISASMARLLLEV